MKFRYLPILAIALVVGCSKSAPSGAVASNSATDAGASSNPSTANSASTTPGPTSSSSTGGAGTTATSPVGPGQSKSPAATAPPKGPGATATTPPVGATAVPGSQAAAQPNAAQQAQAQQMQADQMKKAQENGAKAEKATPSKIAGVSGTYFGFIDEAKIKPEFKTQPGFKDNLAKAKDAAKKVTVTVAANGDVVLKGMGKEPVKGFCSSVDGQPAFVFNLVNAPAGVPKKQFAAVKVKESGGIIEFGPLSFKRG